MTRTQIPLRFKIVFLIAFLLASVTLGVGWLFSSSFIQDNQTLIQELNFEQALKIGTQLQEDLQITSNRLQSEGKDIFFRGAIAKDSDFTYIALLSRAASGSFEPEKILKSSENGIDVQFNEDWQATLARVTDQDARVHSVNLPDGKFAIALLIPYIESTHEFSGRVLVGIPRANQISPLLGENDQSRTVLVTSQGTLIAQGGGSDFKTAEISSQPCVKAFLERQVNNGQTHVYDTAHHGNVLCTFRALSFGDLGLVTEIPESAAFISIRNVEYRTGLTATILLCLAFILGSLLSDSITRPIGELVKMAGTIAKGDFDTPINVKYGNEVGSLAKAFAKMIQELKLRQQALVDQEKLATAGRMARNIGHEFGNLLQPMIVKLDLLQQKLVDSGSPELGDQVEELIQIATLGSGICGGLMTLAREQPDALKFTRVSVSKLVSKALGLLSHELKVKDISTQMDIPQDFEINIVEAQILQVLINLMVNAIHAMNNGGHLNVACDRVEGKVLLSIQDNGCGIAPENLSKIFEPLFSTKGAKGNGLGLSIAKSTLELHGGEIRVESEVGKGTKMILVFPSRRASDARAA